MYIFGFKLREFKSTSVSQILFFPLDFSELTVNSHTFF